MIFADNVLKIGGWTFKRQSVSVRRVDDNSNGILLKEKYLFRDKKHNIFLGTKMIKINICWIIKFDIQIEDKVNNSILGKAFALCCYH